MAATTQRIGRFRIEGVIGTGGFATVYRGSDDRLDADVAIKVLAENHSLNPDVRERFIAEGRRLRRVRSPHVVTVHDLGETATAQPYLVLEWADRGDLGRRVAEARQRGYRPDVGDGLAIARTLAAALTMLHDLQIVHRDLSPGNLLLRSTAPDVAPPRPDVSDGGSLIAEDEQLLLADLGLSKDLAVASGVTAAAGTSGFAAPEQRIRAGSVDHRADVWAASALLVWLATGRPPDDTPGRARRELDAAGWPAPVTGVLVRGLAAKPANRHPDMRSWLKALEDAASPAPPQPQPERGGAPSTWRSRPIAWLTAAALLVGALLGAAATAALPIGPSVRTEQLPGGGERTTVADHGITIVMEGPTATQVGQRRRLNATVTGAATWTWVGPDGTLRPQAAAFDFLARAPGRAAIRLLAIDERGQIVEATRKLQVSEDTP